VASITFACGAPTGGALASTTALAEEAVAAGHSVRLVVAAVDAYGRLPRLTSALVRAEAASRFVGAAAWRVHDALSATTDPRPEASLVERAADVPAAVRHLHEPGALLVINSVRRLDLRRLIEVARRSGSATVWYLREAASLVTLASGEAEVDVLVANSRPLAEQARDVAGRPCAYVPSVISRDGLVEPSSRDVLLAVNPIPSHGLDLLLQVSRLVPNRRVVLQESWPIEPAPLAHLMEQIAELPSVELRRRTVRSEVFRDAWALLLPHSGDELGAARPRVALEAQLLGIPLVAHDISGLASAAASPELLVPEGAPPEAWATTLDLLAGGYEAFSDKARSYADREMPSGSAIWAAFSEACGPALG
jgi:glycosyltransferase involved in cell wall biosynthesis